MSFWRALLRKLRADRAGKACKPLLVRGDGTLDLRFAEGVGQSRMRVDDPDRLAVDYTRTMLGALLLHPRAQGPRRVGMVGLGGGSQAKFLHRHLPDAAIEAIEINPHVLALREVFRIPPDDARLRVRLADAARLLRDRRGRYDLLLVDGYDVAGIPAALSTQAFYDDCQRALASDGVLAANLYCDDHAAHFARLRRSFGGRALLLEEPRQSNRVAFGWNGGLRALDAAAVETALQRLPAEAREQLAGAFASAAAAVALAAAGGSPAHV